MAVHHIYYSCWNKDEKNNSDNININNPYYLNITSRFWLLHRFLRIIFSPFLIIPSSPLHLLQSTISSLIY